jgi:hypothetical protein
LIQKRSTGVARAVRKSLVSIAVSEAGDNKWAVCPPGHHAIRSLPRAKASCRGVAGAIGLSNCVVIGARYPVVAQRLAARVPSLHSGLPLAVAAVRRTGPAVAVGG